MIKITDTLYYDPELPLYEQDKAVQEYVLQLMETPPVSEITEDCLGGFKRPIRREWRTETGARIIEDREYNEPAESAEFMGVNNFKGTVYGA